MFELRSMLMRQVYDKHGPTLLLPYAMIRHSERGVMMVALQYDGDRTAGKHVDFKMSDYLSAPTAMVSDGGKEHVVPLVKADSEYHTKEIISIPFGNGALWGRFPKL